MGSNPIGGTVLIASLAKLARLRIAPCEPAYFVVVRGREACPLAPPRHGGGAIRVDCVDRRGAESCRRYSSQDGKRCPFRPKTDPLAVLRRETTQRAPKRSGRNITASS